MENFIKLIRQIVSIKPLLQHLKDLKEKSKESGLGPERKKKIFHQRLRILASIVLTGTAISIGFFIMMSFSVYLYKTSKILENLKNDRPDLLTNINPYKQIVMDHPKIYNRVFFKHAGIYALARDLTDHLETKEKKLLKIYLYIKDKVQLIDDDLPKSIFYFPDEVLEEEEGNSREASILAASMLCDIGIGSQLIEAGKNMSLKISGIDTTRYKEAMEELLENDYVLFAQDFIINSSAPMVMKIPDRLTGLDLNVTVFAKHPIMYEIIGTNQEKKESYSRDKLTIETLQCRFEMNDSIRVSTTEYPIVEASVSFSIHKSGIIKMAPQSKESDGTDINLSFINNSILSFLGATPYQTSNVNIYPIMPKDRIISRWEESQPKMPEKM